VRLGDLHGSERAHPRSATKHHEVRFRLRRRTLVPNYALRIKAYRYDRKHQDFHSCGLVIFVGPKERTHEVPRSITKLGFAEGDEQLRIRYGRKHQDFLSSGLVTSVGPKKRTHQVPRSITKLGFAFRVKPGGQQNRGDCRESAGRAW
jgi:hypothetical protein